MATDPPLNSVTLGASSVADDLGYVALYDLAQALDGVTSEPGRSRRSEPLAAPDAVGALWVRTGGHTWAHSAVAPMNAVGICRRL
jgi:hypothetical protein